MKVKGFRKAWYFPYLTMLPLITMIVWYQFSFPANFKIWYRTYYSENRLSLIANRPAVRINVLHRITLGSCYELQSFNLDILTLAGNGEHAITSCPGRLPTSVLYAQIYTQ